MANWWSPRQWFRFYRKKTPFGKREPKEFKRPERDEDYELMLHYEGFIAPLHWEDDDLTQYPAIQQDLRDLEEYLLPSFWEYNQKSRYYQVRYHTYQWIFIIGAFLTTMLGALSTYYAGNEFNGTVTAADRIVILGFTVSAVQFFSVATTIVSGFTGYYTIMSNQGQPRQRWASYRRLAEELRMLYFKFVSRLDPYDKTNRVEALRKRVLEIREQEISSAS